MSKDAPGLEILLSKDEKVPPPAPLSLHILEGNSQEAGPGSVERRDRERGNERAKCFLLVTLSAPRLNYRGSTILTITTGRLSTCKRPANLKNVALALT